MAEVKSVVIGQLVLLADRYCESTGESRSSVAKAIHGRGGHIDDLAAGRRDLTTRSAQDAMRWFSQHWPADLEWPADIGRPALVVSSGHLPRPTLQGPRPEAGQKACLGVAQ